MFFLPVRIHKQIKFCHKQFTKIFSKKIKTHENIIKFSFKTKKNILLKRFFFNDSEARTLPGPSGPKIINFVEKK